MNAIKLHQRIGVLRKGLQRSLNNLYIWTQFSRQALETARADDEFLTRKSFRVPSRIRNKEVDRTPEQLKDIAKHAVEHEIYFSVFVYAVAQVEAFIGDVLLELLRFDSRRLKTRIKGIDHTSKIEVSELIDCASREELLESVIRKELIGLFYAAPSLQMEYLQSVTGVKLSDDSVGAWIEVKATRDIVVHNSGIANDVYVRKAGNHARAIEGAALPMDDKYFGVALAAMKSLVGKVSSGIQLDLKKK